MSEKIEFYKMEVTCMNCFWHGQIECLKGIPIGQRECPNCECVTLKPVAKVTL